MWGRKLFLLIVLQITINYSKEISANLYQFGPTTPRIIRVRNQTEARAANHQYFVYDFVSRINICYKNRDNICLFSQIAVELIIKQGSSLIFY